jgi:hypothetical protein
MRKRQPFWSPIPGVRFLVSDSALDSVKADEVTDGAAMVTIRVCPSSGIELVLFCPQRDCSWRGPARFVSEGRPLVSWGIALSLGLQPLLSCD